MNTKRNTLFTVFLMVIFLWFSMEVARAQGVDDTRIDWNAFPWGSRPPAGFIVTDEWNIAYSVPLPFVVSAAGGINGDAVIFDSSFPTSGDVDLGTPNDICDDGLPNGSAPGIGEGGNTTNCAALGNVLIVEEKSIDADGDGYIDGPPDDTIGAVITLTWEVNVKAVEMTLVDQEGAEVAMINAYDAAGNLAHTLEVDGLGDNSVHVIPLGWNNVQVIEVDFRGSGGIAGFVVGPPDDPTAVELSAFGVIGTAFPWDAALVALAVTGMAIAWFLTGESVDKRPKNW